jgi:hypothetical protein
LTAPAHVDTIISRFTAGRKKEKFHISSLKFFYVRIYENLSLTKKPLAIAPSQQNPSERNLTVLDHFLTES